MPSGRNHTWQDIQNRILDNIKNQIWLPGELIPGEVVLAEEFGCARTTVNRALRELANTGVVNRKRKAGTRVATQSTRTITAEIPIIRTQVEDRQSVYRFSVLECRRLAPGKAVQTAMRLRAKTKALHVRCVHYADEQPFIYEDRWINTLTIPAVVDVDLRKISANEWLVKNVPFTNGEFVVEAVKAGSSIAKALELDSTDAVLQSRRTTWLEGDSVTLVNLYYSPGFQMHFLI